MNELEVLIHNLQQYSIYGNIAISVVLIIGFFVTAYWQKNQIDSLKAYVDLWKPEKLKADMDAWRDMQVEFNKATIDDYKKQLKESMDKEALALKIIENLQKQNSDMAFKLLLLNNLSSESIAPSGGSVEFKKEEGLLTWIVNYKNGMEKKFSFPLERFNGTDNFVKITEVILSKKKKESNED
jgi:hypothetical protein